MNKLTETFSFITPETIIIEEIGLDAIEKFASVTERIWEGSVFNKYWSAEEWTEIYKYGYRPVYILSNHLLSGEKIIVGTFTYSPMRFFTKEGITEFDDAFIIDRFGIREPERFKGLGTKALELFESEMVEKGYTTAWIVAEPTELRFWKKNGYTKGDKYEDPDYENLTKAERNHYDRLFWMSKNLEENQDDR